MTKLVFFQYWDDNEISRQLMSDNELIRCIDASNYTGIHIIKIFDVSEPTNIYEIHYVGWQPNCLIQFADSKGNVVLSGYGTDH